MLAMGCLRVCEWVILGDRRKTGTRQLRWLLLSGFYLMRPLRQQGRFIVCITVRCDTRESTPQSGKGPDG